MKKPLDFEGQIDVQAGNNYPGSCRVLQNHTRVNGEESEKTDGTACNWREKKNEKGFLMHPIDHLPLQTIYQEDAKGIYRYGIAIWPKLGFF